MRARMSEGGACGPTSLGGTTRGVPALQGLVARWYSPDKLFVSEFCKKIQKKSYLIFRTIGELLFLGYFSPGR